MKFSFLFMMERLGPDLEQARSYGSVELNGAVAPVGRVIPNAPKTRLIKDNQPYQWEWITA
jgi:hypothetical protein